MPTKALGYVRVSTQDQADSGLGLEAQSQAIKAYAAARIVNLATIHRDVISGSSAGFDRPGLAAALTDLKRGDCLIVARRDRLGRDPINVALIESHLERRGCRLISTAGEGTSDDPSDPAAQLIRRVVDAVAEYERLLIGLRTKAALRVKRQAGFRTGGIPFGYTLHADGKRLVPDPATIDVARRIVNLRRGGMTLRAIAATLASDGIQQRNGSTWHPQVISSVVRHWVEPT